MLSLNAYYISLPNRAHIVMHNFFGVVAVSTWQKALMDTVGGSPKRVHVPVRHTTLSSAVFARVLTS